MTEKRDRPTIEITPEMRAAGALVLQESSESFHEEQLAEAIYTAMKQARLQRGEVNGADQG